MNTAIRGYNYRDPHSIRRGVPGVGFEPTLSIRKEFFLLSILIASAHRRARGYTVYRYRYYSKIEC